MILLIDIIFVVGMACVTAFVIRFTFYWLDGAVRDEVRAGLWDSLRGVPTAVGVLPQAHALLFALFGEKYVSRRSFFVSCAMSMLLFFVLAVTFRKTWTGEAYTDVATFFVAMPIFGLIVNGIPDYGILLKSRRIFAVAAALPSRRQKIELLSCDLIAGLTFKLLIVALIDFAVSLSDGDTIAQAAESVVQLARNTQGGGKPTMSLVLFTATAASAPLWLCLYMLSLHLIRRICRVATFRARKPAWLDEERMQAYPLCCVGDMAGIIAALTLLIFGGLTSLLPAI